MGRTRNWWAIFFFLHCQWNPTPTADASLHPPACEVAVRRQLSKWGSRDEWMRQVRSMDGSLLFRSPTRQTAVWVQMRLRKDGAVSLARLTPQSFVAASWDQNTCQAKLARTGFHFDERRLASTFSDETLKQLLKTHRRGVIYALSPRMPYSLVALAAIKRACDEFHVPLVLVLDPRADRPSAAQTVQRLGMSPVDLKTMESFELYQRGMLNHFPSLVLFSQGQVITYAYPGLKEASVYASYLKEQFGF